MGLTTWHLPTSALQMADLIKITIATVLPRKNPIVIFVDFDRTIVDTTSDRDEDYISGSIEAVLADLQAYENVYNEHNTATRPPSQVDRCSRAPSEACRGRLVVAQHSEL